MFDISLGLRLIGDEQAVMNESTDWERWPAMRSCLLAPCPRDERSKRAPESRGSERDSEMGLGIWGGGIWGKEGA